jgi:hypothetical protein
MNYHFIVKNGISSEYITSTTNGSFNLEEKGLASHPYLWTLVIASIAIIMSVAGYRRKIVSDNVWLKD